METQAKMLLNYVLKTENFKESVLSAIKLLTESQEKAGFELLKKLYKSEPSPEIASLLGFCFYFGVGVKKNWTWAMNYASFAHQKENLLGDYTIGLIYFDEKNVDRDLKKAMEHFERLAGKNYPPAQSTIGFCKYNDEGERNYKKAVEWFKKAAYHGYAPSQYNLAMCYLLGHGVIIDCSEGVEWLEKAALQGHIEAQHNLGKCYIDGYGIKKNPEKGLGLFFLAANEGDVLSVHHMRNSGLDPSDFTFATKFETISPKKF